MRKIYVVLAFLAVLMAFAACNNPAGGGDSSGESGGTPNTPVDLTGFSSVNRYMATSNVNSGKIKGSFKSGGLNYYYIYLGQMENIPLFYGEKYYYSPELGYITYIYTKATTDTISETVIKSSSQTVSVSEKHTKSSTSETTLKAEASVKYQGFGVTAEAKASAEQKWKTYTEDTSGFQKDTSFANTIEKGTSKAETTQQSWSIALTEKHRVGYYRFTFFSVSDVYLWVIRDPAQPDALELEFKEYINPAEFIWKMDYTDPSNPDFNKTDDTKFQFDLSVLDSLPPPEVDLDYVTGISILNKTGGLEVGKTYSFIADVEPVYATKKNVTWTSSNPAVATVSNIGVVTGVKNGTAIITVTADDRRGGVKTDTCEVKVSDVKIPVTDLGPKNLSIRLEVEDNSKLTPVFTPSNATDQQLTWSSSNPAIATVENSKVTAIAVGTTTITATADDKTNGEKKATWVVTVDPVRVKELTLDRLTYNLDFPDKLDKIVGKDGNVIIDGNDKTVTLTCVVLPDKAANKNVIWTSSNPTVATVSENGVVTAKAAGKTTITATSAENGKISKSCVITVRGTWNVAIRTDWENAVAGIRLNRGGDSEIERKTYVINIDQSSEKPGPVVVYGSEDEIITFGEETTNISVTLTGSGILRLKSKGRLLTIGNSQIVTINGPTLKGLDKYDSSNPTYDVVIDHNKTAFVNVHLGGNLMLEDGRINGNVNANTIFGGGVYIQRGGSFTMSGGEISWNNCTSGNGGGVYVESGSTFKMTGGTFAKNKAKDYGGGVYVAKGDNTTFEKTGGIIWGKGDVSENLASSGHAVAGYIGNTLRFRNSTLLLDLNNTNTSNWD